ncbi:MAG TPA: aminodeoxychorismate/anthranilate synthase component II [Gemmatimonadales bacterium]
MSSPLHVVFIDNFDSFTFNLVDEFARRGATVEVWRNTVRADHALARAMGTSGPRLVVLSPGPGGPRDAGCCLELLRRAGPAVPVFGVCLGHQAMIDAWGGVVESAGAILHGRSSRVTHDGQALFEGIPSPVTVGRYHSLASHAVPPELESLAWADRIVMAVRHRTLPQIGIQFHPESILTPHGGRLIENVIRWAGA